MHNAACSDNELHAWKANMDRHRPALFILPPKEIHSQRGLVDVAKPHEVEVRPGRGFCGDEKIDRPDLAADCPGARSAEYEVERN